jgi:NADH-quinone oxidoreductase subunit H
MAFSPIERLPFWLITIPLMFVEIIVAVAIGPLVAYGLDWNEAPHTLYKKWSKHFRYRRPTYNRNLTVEFLTYAYCVTKAFAVAGYFCHDSRTAIKRLINPYSPAVAHEKLKEPYKPSAEVIEQLKFHPNPSTRSAVINAELKTPRTQAKAELIPDTEYLLGLVEQDSVVNFRYGLLLILALSSLAVYSIILAGWSSNSKYAFIGALRSAAQMISYEVAISLILLPIILLAGSMNLTMIIFTQNSTVLFILPLAPAALLFLIAILAETNRTPFDLPEAEAELVAGYNVDYSGLPFAMFFLGEYCNIIFASSLFCLFFLGGGGIDEFSAIMLPLKASFVWIFFVLVRATLPRYRYDQLMDIGWKVFLPVSGSFFIFVIGLLVFFGACPVTSELLH